MTVEAYDQFGVAIERGVLLTYPGRQGSTMWMSTGVVDDVYEIPHPYAYGKRDQTLTKVRLYVVSPKSWKDKTLVVKKVSVECIDRSTVVYTNSMNVDNMPEQRFNGTSKTALLGLITIQEAIIRGFDVPREIPVVSGGADNGTDL